MCPLSLFRQVWCVKMRGQWWGPCLAAASTPILYANKRLFCILTAVRWQGSEWGAAEHQQCKTGAGLSPCVSRDSRNNENFCWDFKANGWSFPVVMANMIRQQARTHLVTHSCQQNPSQWLLLMVQRSKEEEEETSVSSAALKLTLMQWGCNAESQLVIFVDFHLQFVGKLSHLTKKNKIKHTAAMVQTGL